MYRKRRDKPPSLNFDSKCLLSLFSSAKKKKITLVRDREKHYLRYCGVWQPITQSAAYLNQSQEGRRQWRSFRLFPVAKARASNSE